MLSLSLSLVAWYASRMDYTVPQSNLKAILQQHYRRFVVSADFVMLPGGECGAPQIVIEVIFDNGEREFISRGYNNENTRNAIRPAVDLSLAPA